MKKKIMIESDMHIDPPEAKGLAELEWSFESSRSGQPVLKIGGRYIHSRYDPIREAQAIVTQVAAEIASEQATLIILLGSGLGYLPAAFTAGLDVPVLLWEPFPQISRHVSRSRESWQSQLTLVENSREFDSEIRQLIGRGIKPHIVIHPGYKEFVRFEARYILWCLRKYFQLTRPLSIDEAVISKRSLDALERIPFLSAIDELDGCLAGHTAILVAPGPSSHMVQPYLNGCRNRGVVFAAIQSLRSLCEEGIPVDFAVAPDPQEYYTTIYLEGFRPEFTTLLADTSIDPTLLDLWKEKTFLFHLRTQHLHQIFWESCSLPVLDEPLISVSETMLVLAHNFGARQFVLVGMDFCSESLDYKVRFKTPNLSGQPCLTNSHYYHSARYLNFICPRLQELGCRIWRVSDGIHDGLPIGGTELIAPGQIRTVINNEVEFNPPKPKGHVCSERYFEARGLLQRLIEQFDRAQGGPSNSIIATSSFKDFQAIGVNRQRQYYEAALQQLEMHWLGESLGPPK